MPAAGFRLAGRAFPSGTFEPGTFKAAASPFGAFADPGEKPGGSSGRFVKCPIIFSSLQAAGSAAAAGR